MPMIIYVWPQPFIHYMLLRQEEFILHQVNRERKQTVLAIVAFCISIDLFLSPLFSYVVIEKNALKVQQLSNGAEALPRSQEGILSLEAKDFRLQCLQTLTGIKFLLLASVQYNSVLLEKMLNSIYAVYADYGPYIHSYIMVFSVIVRVTLSVYDLHCMLCI